MDYEIETGGTLGEGGEHTPMNYPRPDDEREGSLVENTEVGDDNTVDDEAGSNADQQ